MSGVEDWRELGFPSQETCRFPNIVNVEVLRGACPCRCRHCPVGATAPAARSQRFGAQVIDLGLWDRITAEVGRHPWSMVRIHAVGDPILWRELPAALRIAAANHARTWLFTSAVTKDTTMLDAMCEHAAIVEVSVNSTSRPAYRRSKGVDAFDLVCSNLGHLHSRIVAGAGLRLIASRVESADPAEDQGFVEYWRSSGLVHDAFVRSYHTYNDCMPRLSPACEVPGHQPCLVHWARFNIDLAGQVVVCFNELFKPELDPALILGDCSRQDLAEIWHGSKLTALRRAELSGDYAALPFAGSLPCPSCSSCQPLFSRRETSEHQLSQLDAGEGGSW
jgi:hypothetical protein